MFVVLVEASQQFFSTRQVATGQRDFGAHELDFRMKASASEATGTEFNLAKLRFQLVNRTRAVMLARKVEGNPHPVEFGQFFRAERLNFIKLGLCPFEHSGLEGKTGVREIEAHCCSVYIAPLPRNLDANERRVKIILIIGIENFAIGEFDPIWPIGRFVPCLRTEQDEFAEKSFHEGRNDSDDSSIRKRRATASAGGHAPTVQLPP